MVNPDLPSPRYLPVILILLSSYSCWPQEPTKQVGLGNIDFFISRYNIFLAILIHHIATDEYRNTLSYRDIWSYRDIDKTKRYKYSQDIMQCISWTDVNMVKQYINIFCKFISYLQYLKNRDIYNMMIYCPGLQEPNKNPTVRFVCNLATLKRSLFFLMTLIGHLNFSNNVPNVHKNN